MKKHILAILVALLCMSLLVAFVACGGGGDPVDPETCDHEWWDWEYNPEPTCTTPGDRSRTCSICYKVESEAVPAQHDWDEWDYDVEPTCTEGGRGTRVCLACDKEETSDIPAKGHVEVVEVAEKLPTLTETGCSKGTKCEVCDEQLQKSYTYARLSNITGKSTVTSKNATDFWAFKKEALYDGKLDVGTHALKGKDYSYVFDFEDPAYVTDIIVDINGSGSLMADGTKINSVAYNTKAINIVIYTISEMGSDGNPVYKMYYETGRIDTTALTQVKISTLTGEGLNTFTEPTFASRIELQIFDGTNSGSEYIWEFNVQGSILETECDVKGHQYGGAEIVEEAYCEDDGTDDGALHDGLKQWTCTVCGHKETEVIKASHSFPDTWEVLEPARCGTPGIEVRDCTSCGISEDREIPETQPHAWGDWAIIGTITCESGGERERHCTTPNCDGYERETVPAGTHMNVVTEGYKAPTTEEEGATGRTYCTVCEAEISKSYVISKLVSVTSGATVTSPVPSTTNWSFAEGLLAYMVDGNRETGVCNNWKDRSTMYTIALASEQGVDKIVLVVNSKGKTNENNTFDTLTNHDYKITFILYDGNDQVVYTAETYQTADKTEIVVELPETTNVKKIKIIRDGHSYSVNGYLWEVEAYSGGLVTDKLVCNHEMSDWDEVEPAKCGVDGLKRKDCTLCDYFVEEVIPMPTPHSWGAWSNSTGFSCTNGGTRERTCQNTDCGVTETQTVEPGDHIELVTTGAKEPTLDEAGSTGTTTCTACGETVSEATEIPKLVNAALNATASANTDAWQVAGNGTNWGPNTIPSINDGNLATGSKPMVGSLREVTYYLTWEEAVNLSEVIVVCNGTGNLGHFGDVTDTNYGATIDVKVFDANGSEITNTSASSKDKTEITIDMSTYSTAVAKISVTVYTNYTQAEGAVFEIIAVEKAQ
ncbi:MAG: hypothetical protein IKB27_04925 [Clostridia bacterium]|nr:hypothetical protein [Clostridia bacterium]